MTLYLQDKYINLLTDFGFKRVFGTEPNKHLLIAFLNTLLPTNRQIQDVTFKNNENIGNTPIDRKAIFDIYCQGENGERFIVELQKAKQNFFKDRSVFLCHLPNPGTGPQRRLELQTSARLCGRNPRLHL